MNISEGPRDGCYLTCLMWLVMMLPEAKRDPCARSPSSLRCHSHVTELRQQSTSNDPAKFVHEGTKGHSFPFKMVQVADSPLESGRVLKVRSPGQRCQRDLDICKGHKSLVSPPRATELTTKATKKVQLPQ